MEERKAGSSEKDQVEAFAHSLEILTFAQSIPIRHYQSLHSRSCMPRFSIIVPVYNAESYLLQNIGTILSQSFSDFEVWLVDDGSTDNSGRICDSIALQDSRVHVHHQANAGPSVARNYALSHMCGDWVCFMDADDQVSNTWLEHYAMYCDADIMFQGVRQLLEGAKTTEQKLPDGLEKGKDRYKLIEVIPHGVFNATWSKCIRAEVIRQHSIRFDETCRLSEDLIFCLDALRCSYSLRTIEHINYDYVRTSSVLTKIRQHSEELFHIKKSVIEAIDRFFEEDKGNKAYTMTMTPEMGYLYFFFMVQANKTPKFTRYEIYDWMRSYLHLVDFSRLSWNRKIYTLLSLPNCLFDILLLSFAKVYNTTRKTFHKPLS